MKLTIKHFCVSKSNVCFGIVSFQEREFFGKNGFPRTPFPNGWKGKSGLYAVGFTRRGLSGVASDAIKIAQDIGSVWREETKQQKKKNPIASLTRCISQF